MKSIDWRIALPLRIISMKQTLATGFGSVCCVDARTAGTGWGDDADERRHASLLSNRAIA